MVTVRSFTTTEYSRHTPKTHTSIQYIVDFELLLESKIFLAGNQLYELQTHRIGCCGKKKLIAIFGNKQRLLRLDMKTKIVQHVESD